MADLQSNVALKKKIAGEPYGAHRAATQQSLDPELANDRWRFPGFSTLGQARDLAEERVDARIGAEPCDPLSVAGIAWLFAFQGLQPTRFLGGCKWIERAASLTESWTFANCAKSIIDGRECRNEHRIGLCCLGAPASRRLVPAPLDNRNQR